MHENLDHPNMGDCRRRNSITHVMRAEPIDTLSGATLQVPYTAPFRRKKITLSAGQSADWSPRGTVTLLSLDGN